MELIKKYSALIGVLTFLGGIALVIFDFGAEMNSYESRTFDSPEQKVEHINHVKTSLSPEQQQKQWLLDSLDKVSRIKEREERTKILRQADSARKVSDSINRLNADQLYQIKEELKTLKEND